uniref:Secreted protein n=1 Tax=Panagrellus redivivus TaxID=6233 RepID=A0A7E5A0P1_PANRE
MLFVMMCGMICTAFGTDFIETTSVATIVSQNSTSNSTDLAVRDLESESEPAPTSSSTQTHLRAKRQWGGCRYENCDYYGGCGGRGCGYGGCRVVGTIAVMGLIVAMAVVATIAAMAVVGLTAVVEAVEPDAMEIPAVEPTDASFPSAIIPSVVECVAPIANLDPVSDAACLVNAVHAVCLDARGNASVEAVATVIMITIVVGAENVVTRSNSNDQHPKRKKLPQLW